MGGLMGKMAVSDGRPSGRGENRPIRPLDLLLGSGRNVSVSCCSTADGAQML